MLLRVHRFHGHASLGYLHAKGRTVRGQGISLRYVPNKTRQAYRAAVIVSKKVSKSAVVRNRIRRRVFEYVRLHGESIDELDFAVMVYDASFATMPADQLGGILDAVFIKMVKSGDSPKPHATLDKRG